MCRQPVRSGKEAGPPTLHVDALLGLFGGRGFAFLGWSGVRGFRVVGSELRGLELHGGLIVGVWGLDWVRRGV